MPVTSKTFGLLLAGAFILTGCGQRPATPVFTLQNIGSDTMVNLAQAWAEAYSKVEPGVSVEVSGGGSGLGIAALINGTADLGNSSRKIEEKELKLAEQHNGKAPREFMVGYDALSVYVHRNNPIEEIALDQLKEIFAEGGGIDRWEQLGVQYIPGAHTGKIIRVSRQNNSGTYQYFRDTVCGKNTDFKLGSLDMNGSKDVVELIAHTPGAIGFSGLGYNIPTVKILKVAPNRGAPSVYPSVRTTLDRSYPIARPMFMYSPDTPRVAVRAYLDWIFSPAGQRIVQETGYVPLQEL